MQLYMRKFYAILISIYKKARGITMKFFEKNPFIMIVIGVVGISLSSIFVKYSPAPSAVTAAWRLLWSVILLSPVVLGTQQLRRELVTAAPRNILLSSISGIFLAIHFALWFESLKHTSIASSTTIVCTEVIWVSLGFWLFLTGLVTLLDSLGKRMAWLERILPELSIEATCITARAEEFAPKGREKYDYATSRAVARLNILLELTAPYVKVGGAVLAMELLGVIRDVKDYDPAPAKIIYPNPEMADFYAKKFARYMDCYNGKC